MLSLSPWNLCTINVALLRANNLLSQLCPSLLKKSTCSLKMLTNSLGYKKNEEWVLFLLFPSVFSFHLPRVAERSLDQGHTFNLVFSHQWMRKNTFLSINYFLSQLHLNLFKKSFYSPKCINYSFQVINTRVMSFVPFY